VTSPPLESGFGHFYGFLGAEVAYFHHTSRNRQVDWQRNGETIHETGYSTFLLSDEAIRLIQERDQQMPFYLQVSFNAPQFRSQLQPITKQCTARYRNRPLRAPR